MDDTHSPVLVQRGFLPHFIPNGLTLDFCPGASGAFEIFWYEPEHFDEVIAPIDRLESFVPGRKPRWYERTLVEMKIIPDDYDGPHADLIDDIFNEGLNMRQRNIGILEKNWDFPCCPVWVYSNPEANEDCIATFIEKNDGNAFVDGKPSKSVCRNPILWRGIETKIPKDI